MLEKISDIFAEQRVAVLTINNDRSDKAMKRVLEQAKTTLPVLRDRKSEIVDAYRAYAIPTIYLIDQQGKIYNCWVGASKDLESELSEHNGFVLQSPAVPQLAQTVEPATE